jgi:type III secretion protein L
MSAPVEAPPLPGVPSLPLRWIDKQQLSRCLSRVVRRAEFERLVSAQELAMAARESAVALQHELDALKRDAVREGHALGVEQGRQAWAQQLAERHLARQAQLRSLQPALLELVMGTVRHLVQALPAEQRFELLAQQVLSSAIRARHLRLVVATSDGAAAQAMLIAWQRAHPHVVALDVVEDEALRSGDCVLETDEGAIDGRLEQRLVDIEAALSRHLSAVVPSLAEAGRSAQAATGEPAFDATGEAT